MPTMPAGGVVLGGMLGGVHAVELLDALTQKPSSVLLATSSVPYQSSTARRLTALFSHKQQVAPMVQHTEAGLVLYERVVTAEQEGSLLKKLTTPKFTHAGPVPGGPATILYSGGAGAPHLTGSPGRARLSPVRPSSALGDENCTSSSQPGPQPVGGISRVTQSHRVPTAPDTTSSATRPTVQPHTTSHQQWHAGGTTQVPAQSLQAHKTANPRKHFAPSGSQHVAEEKTQQYYQQQRATMTHHFTWGGRLKWQRAKLGADTNSQHHMNQHTAHMAPLRLDAFTDD
mmetsp:Transcript_8647/g.14899  ORF Transcript_8647/g.14899 Transcript_8647/m.14899 type:complete len:286 (-) Transcript_8647:268-1125(-)